MPSKYVTIKFTREQAWILKHVLDGRVKSYELPVQKLNVWRRVYRKIEKALKEA